MIIKDIALNKITKIYSKPFLVPFFISYLEHENASPNYQITDLIRVMKHPDNTTMLSISDVAIVTIKKPDALIIVNKALNCVDVHSKCERKLKTLDSIKRFRECLEEESKNLTTQNERLSSVVFELKRFENSNLLLSSSEVSGAILANAIKDSDAMKIMKKYIMKI